MVIGSLDNSGVAGNSSEEQKWSRELDTELRVDSFPKMEEITMNLCSGWNDPVEAKLMMPERKGYG